MFMATFPDVRCQSSLLLSAPFKLSFSARLSSRQCQLMGTLLSVGIRSPLASHGNFCLHSLRVLFGAGTLLAGSVAAGSVLVVDDAVCAKDPLHAMCPHVQGFLAINDC